MEKSDFLTAVRTGNIQLLTQYLRSDSNGDLFEQTVKHDAFCLAAEQGLEDIGEVILDDDAAGVNKLYGPQALTALHIAASCTALHLAALKGYLDVVEALADAGGTFELTGPGVEKSALAVAAEAGHVDVVDFLITRTDHTDEQMALSLVLAPGNGHLEVLKVITGRLRNDFYRRRKHDGFRALILSIAAGHLDIAKYLLDEWVDMSATETTGHPLSKYLVQWAVQGPSVDVLRFLVARHPELVNYSDELTNLMALGLACIGGPENVNLKVVRALIIDGNGDANIMDTKSETALTLAAKKGSVELVRMLVTEGNAKTEVANRHGVTPLIWAAKYGYVEVVRVLLVDGNANINAKDNNGVTALMTAAIEDKSDSDRALIRYGKGLDIDARDYAGRTPLMGAAARGNSAAALELVLAGSADVMAKDRRGRTVRHYFTKSGLQSESAEYMIFELLLGGMKSINRRVVYHGVGVDLDDHNALIHSLQNETVPFLNIPTDSYP